MFASWCEPFGLDPQTNRINLDLASSNAGVAVLSLQLNGATLDALFERLDATHAENGGPESRILSLARGYLVFAREHPNLWGVVNDPHTPEGLVRSLVRGYLRGLAAR